MAMTAEQLRAIDNARARAAALASARQRVGQQQTPEVAQSSQDARRSAESGLGRIPGLEWMADLPNKAVEGLTFGLSDELWSGGEAAARSAGDLLQGRAPDFGKYFNEAQSRGQQVQDIRSERSPTASAIGEIGGAVAGGAGLAKAGLSLMRGAAPTVISMAPRMAAEGALYGAAHGAGHGTNDRLGDAAWGAGVGGVMGLGTGIVFGTLARMSNPQAKLPEIYDLQAQKTAAYKAVDQSGARYSGNAMDDLINIVETDVRQANFNPARHPKAASVLSSELQQLRGHDVSLTELDQIRQVVRMDVADAADASDARIGRIIIGAIDDFIDGAGQAQMAAGSGPQAAAAIQSARQLNQTFRKSELLADTIARAQRRAASTGSGGNVDNAIRQNVRRLLDNPRLARSFTQEEKDIMEAVVRGGKWQNLLRLIGKLSPSGNGLMAALGIGGTVANPALATIPIAGMAAKNAADRMTRGGVDALTQLVRTGGSAPAIPGGLMNAVGSVQGLTGQQAPQIPSYLKLRPLPQR